MDHPEMQAVCADAAQAPGGTTVQPTAAHVLCDTAQKPAAMTDLEPESHICDLGQLMLVAYAEGNRQAAEQWLELQRQAINSRSPEVVQAMETWLGLTPCQFVVAGDADRAAMEAGR